MDTTAFSLALGGGGARGLAHIGVIRILEEQGLSPRAVSGTSMGAIIATLLALGHTSHDMERIVSELTLMKLVDFDMKKGLIRGAKIEKYLDTIFAGKSFSDTIIPLSVIATDVDTGERVTFTEGRLSHAVRASIGIPGVFSPFLHEGRYLVDGGLVNNLPIEVLPEGKVIAVSAMRDLTRKVGQRKKRSLLDWQSSLIAHGYNILQKTIDIMLAQNEYRSTLSRTDVIYIRPEFDGLDYYEFSKYRDFIESGAHAAKKLSK